MIFLEWIELQLKFIIIYHLTRQKQIKKQYKILAQKYHPDKNQGDKSANDKFVELAQAYEALGNEEKRRIYDQYGEEGLNNSGQESHDPFDIFSQFAGFGFNRKGSRQKKGPEIRMSIDITLEEVYMGDTIELEINKQIICPKCRGSGAKDANDVHTCSSCRGSGIKIIRQMLAPGMYQQMQTTCDVCGGKGKVVKSKCPTCNGRKVKRGSEQTTISIERGMWNGQEIRVQGGGDQSPDHNSGDIIFQLKVAPHAIFERKGDHLYVSDTLSLKEALLGFQHQITHLDGRKINIERKGVTQNGYVEVLKNEGMPRHEFPSEKGSLFVTFQVYFPDKISMQDQKTLENIL